MATKGDQVKDELIGTIVLLWRQAPAQLSITGPFQLVQGSIDGDELPNKDPKNIPWGRLNVRLTSSQATNIKGTTVKVNGTATLQIFCRRTRSDAYDVVQKIGSYFIDNTKTMFRSRVPTSDVVLNNMRSVDRPMDDGYNRQDFQFEFFWYERRK